jgi:hypothetical protein
LNTIKFVIAVSLALLAFGFISEKLAYGIYEDQLIVCNFEDKCVTIDIDDYMSKEKSDHLWSQYNNDIDTFSTIDIILEPTN